MNPRYDRSALLLDAEYFATELIRRLESLHRRDATPRQMRWRQSSTVIKLVRQELRAARAGERRRRLREHRLKESRR